MLSKEVNCGTRVKMNIALFSTLETILFKLAKLWASGTATQNTLHYSLMSSDVYTGQYQHEKDRPSMICLREVRFNTLPELNRPLAGLTDPVLCAPTCDYQM